jgi:hypothetical protein
MQALTMSARNFRRSGAVSTDHAPGWPSWGHSVRLSTYDSTQRRAPNASQSRAGRSPHLATRPCLLSNLPGYLTAPG